MAWAIVQHVAWEGPGLIAAALEARGARYRVYHMERGEALPEAAAMDGLVVMGGTMGVYEAGKFPHLRAEVALLRECMALGKPVLGVCLGAQLLAAALGSEVTRGPVMELGAGAVQLTAAGRDDAVLGGEGRTQLAVVHWHQDTFPLPQGAALLATSELYERQAFRAGKNVYGWQFHGEVDRALAEAWRPRGLELSVAEVERVGAAGREMIDRFLNVSGV